MLDAGRRQTMLLLVLLGMVGVFVLIGIACVLVPWVIQHRKWRDLLGCSQWTVK